MTRACARRARVARLRIPPETRSAWQQTMHSSRPRLRAVVEPELGLTLGDLGLLRDGAAAPAPGAHRGGPARGGLAGHRRAGRGDPPRRPRRAGRRGGRARLRRDERARSGPALRQRLRAGMLGDDRPARARPTTTHGHDHAGHGHGHAPRAGAGVPRPGRHDAGHRRVVGQGRCRQVDGDGEPGHRAGAGRPQRRACSTPTSTASRCPRCSARTTTRSSSATS